MLGIWQVQRFACTAGEPFDRYSLAYLTKRSETIGAGQEDGT
jgi:hypothetical protein